MQFGNEESEAIDLSSAGQHLIGTFSTQTMVHIWKESLEDVVEAGTLTTFERHLNKSVSSHTPKT